MKSEVVHRDHRRIGGPLCHRLGIDARAQWICDRLRSWGEIPFDEILLRPRSGGVIGALFFPPPRDAGTPAPQPPTQYLWISRAYEVTISNPFYWTH